MGFWRRLRIYLIGFGLGLLIVYGIFGDRDLTKWTPERKILIAIDSSEVSISERALCQLNCHGFSERDIPDLMRDADIDFSESNTAKEPCPIYNISSQEEKYHMLWEVCEREEKVLLLDFVSDQSCACK